MADQTMTTPTSSNQDKSASSAKLFGASQSGLGKPALTGIKIADFSRVLAGPYATMMLADLGAEVIKIERPGVGDETRGWGPPFDAQGNATYFQSVNRNKVNIVLDLNQSEDQERARDLILASDVVVENFGFGGMKKFGLDYATLKESKPKIIFCSITGFGNSEVGQNLPGYDLLIQGMSGLMSITGETDGVPTKVGVALIDVVAGLHAVTGILSALRARDQFGIGQEVNINLFSSALSALVNQSGAFVSAGIISQRLGNSHPSIVPYGVFHASDRAFIVAVGNDQQFQRLSTKIGLTDEERFKTNSSRVLHRIELETKLNSIFATKTATAWIGLLQEEQIPVGPINNISEAFDLAKALELQAIVEIQGARSVANPIQLSESAIQYLLPPPELK